MILEQIAVAHTITRIDFRYGSNVSFVEEKSSSLDFFVGLVFLCLFSICANIGNKAIIIMVGIINSFAPYVLTKGLIRYPALMPAIEPPIPIRLKSLFA